MDPEKQADLDSGNYAIGTIVEVQESDDSWTITMETRRSEQPQWAKLKLADPTMFPEGDESVSTQGLGLAKSWGVRPKVADTVRVFTHQGAFIHGVDLNEVEVFYQNSAAQEAERISRQIAQEEKRKADFEANKIKLDADYDSLPANFQKRIDKFRATLPSWRWEYEAYEMSCCVDAVKVVKWFRSQGIQNIVLNNDSDEGAQAAYEEFKSQIDDNLDEIQISDVHSGNSLAFMIRLAWLELTESWAVYYEHGALAKLVGCDGYGCPHPYDPDGRITEILAKAQNKETTGYGQRTV